MSLRDMDYSVDVALTSFNDNKGLKKFLVKTDQRNIPYLIILGLNADEEIIFKNMTNKEQYVFNNMYLTI